MSHYIVADIGGTNARFAMVAEDDALQELQIFPCADYPHLEDAIRSYMQIAAVADVSGICLAIAGPAEGDYVDLPNNHWQFRPSELQASLGVPLKVINDFTAQALCLDLLSERQFHWLGQPRPKGGQIRAVVGPGTGLGVAAILPGGDIIPSEGGHVAFAPSNDHELALLRVLWQRHGRVSVERLLSGQGLQNLYWANAQLLGEEREMSPQNISAGAAAGDALCNKAVEDFCDILASATGDVALMFWAADGLYLSGGILPKIWEFVEPERFRKRFEDKGRFREFCESLPIALVGAEQPGLLGCFAALKNED